MYIYICVYIPMSFQYSNVYIYTYIHMCVCVHICIYIYNYIYDMFIASLYTHYISIIFPESLPGILPLLWTIFSPATGPQILRKIAAADPPADAPGRFKSLGFCLALGIQQFVTLGIQSHCDMMKIGGPITPSSW